MTGERAAVPVLYPTWFLPAARPLSCVRRVAAAGFDGPSFLAGTVADPRRLDRLSAAEAAELRNALADAGGQRALHVWTDSFLKVASPERAGGVIRANVEACVEALCGPELPPPTVTLDPPVARGPGGPELLRELAEGLVRFLAELSDRYGAPAGIENWPFAPAGCPTSLAPALQAGEGKVGMLLDTGHAHVALSAEWCAERDPAAFVRALPAPIVEVHLHDNMGASDEHLMPGEGTADLGALLDAALATGFAGPVTVECDLTAPGRPGLAGGRAHIRKSYGL
jgi:sugar phosphate isomerase/epimerase